MYIAHLRSSFDVVYHTFSLNTYRVTIWALRAIEVLEHIGIAQAQSLLERLAGGLPASRLTQEAKASLQRLHFAGQANRSEKSAEGKPDRLAPNSMPIAGPRTSRLSV